MAARDTKYLLSIVIESPDGKEEDEEGKRKDLIITATVTEEGEPREDNGISIWWNDVPVDAMGIEPRQWLVDRVNKRLRRVLKGRKLSADGDTLEISGKLGRRVWVQEKFIAAIWDQLALGNEGLKRAPKRKKDRRTKRGRGE